MADFSNQVDGLYTNVVKLSIKHSEEGLSPYKYRAKALSLR